MPVGNTQQQQLPGFGSAARAAMRSAHKRPAQPRFDAALRRGLKRPRAIGERPTKPAKIAPPDPGDVLQRLASLTITRQRRVEAGELDPTKLFHIGSFKNTVCVFEALRRAAAAQGGNYCDLTEAQLIAMLAKIKPAWAQPDGVDASERAQNRRDQHITSLRRWRGWMRDAGWVRYEVITDLSEDQTALYTRYWINPPPSLLAFDDELLERCFAQMQRWVAEHGNDLDTGARYAVPNFWAHARPESQAVRTMKAIARGRAKAQRLRALEASKTVLAPPRGGAAHNNPLTATNRRGHTRIEGQPNPKQTTAANAGDKSSNSRFEGGEAGQDPQPTWEMTPETLPASPDLQTGGDRRRLAGYGYWQRDLTFDLEAYNRDVLAWVFAGQHGSPPQPGSAIVSGPKPDAGYRQALSVYERLLAERAPSGTPPAVRGPFDGPDGRLDTDAYDAAVRSWAFHDEVGLPPHPGQRPRRNRRDPGWHRAIERYNALVGRLGVDVVDGPRGRAGLQACARVLDGRLLCAASDRDLRAFWITHRWGAQDLDARDLYGAGPELTDAERHRIVAAEAVYFAHLAGREGWPDTAVEGLARIARQRLVGQLVPIDTGSQVGGLRLLMDGVRRLVQEARRARNRARVRDRERRSELAARRQRRGDHRRASPSKLAFRARLPASAKDPDYVSDPDAAFRWQLAHLPREILIDPEGLPVLDDHGRFVSSPMYRPEGADDPLGRKHLAAARAQWRPVYLRLGLPLPPEHDGAFYQALKASGRLPRPVDAPLPGPGFLVADHSLDVLRNHNFAVKHGLYDQGHAYRALLRARRDGLADE